MKPLHRVPILLAVAAVAAFAAFAASAQGVVTVNTATGTKPRIQIDGHNALPEDNVWVQILVAGATSLSGVAAEPFQLRLSGLNAGLFSKGNLIADGLRAGSTATVTVRAWDKDTGVDYESADVKASQTFAMILGANPSDNNSAWPQPLVGPGLFAGLTLASTQTPEPGPIALMVLGSVSLWRRQKRQAVP